MPAVGLEPTRSCLQQILSLPRLPFRHADFFRSRVVVYHITGWIARRIFAPVRIASVSALW